MHITSVHGNKKPFKFEICDLQISLALGLSTLLLLAGCGVQPGGTQAGANATSGPPTSGSTGPPDFLQLVSEAPFTTAYRGERLVELYTDAVPAITDSALQSPPGKPLHMHLAVMIVLVRTIPVMMMSRADEGRTLVWSLLTVLEEPGVSCDQSFDHL